MGWKGNYLGKGRIERPQKVTLPCKIYFEPLAYMV
jgi:hypothetical protein